MEEADALKTFASLSHETRLRMLRCLVAAGPDGLLAGQVADTVGASPSRASFHLANLAETGLVTAEKSAREIRYAVRFETLAALITFVMEDCCAGSPALRACCADTLR